MISRRPYARHNRGRVAAITPAPGAPATLLSLTQSLGGVALLDFRDADGYTLSGSDLTGVTNLVSSVAWSIEGAPQWGATMIDSGPGLDLNGTDQWLHSTEAAVVAAFGGGASRTVIYRAEHDSADNNEGVVGAGQPGVSASNRRCFGLNNTGSGCYRDLSTNNAGSTISVLSTSGSSSTSPRTHRWRSDSSTTRLHLDGAGADLGGGAGVAVAHAPGTLTPDTVVIGAIATSTGVVNLMNGRLSVVVIFPSVLSDADCALVEAFLP